MSEPDKSLGEAQAPETPCEGEAPEMTPLQVLWERFKQSSHRPPWWSGHLRGYFR